MDESRRSFLRGKISQTPAGRPPRPPWALENDALFTEKCTRCHECIAVCPTAVLFQGDGGFPEISFKSNGCDLCMKCADSCASAAISTQAVKQPWTWKAVVSSACLAQMQVECRICGEFCDQQAIRFKPRAGRVSTPEIESDLCTGCGHCVSKCPTQAIQTINPPKA